jgi:predicted RecB family nuclease
VKRITGTHIYTYPRCPRAVSLNLHGDPDQRRENTPWEEMVLARGRQVEADHVAGLRGYVEPVYPRREHGVGAEATLELMQDGVEGICQGVLWRGDRLGIPDLLRRVDGRSGLGEHHFEVLDVKSSHRSRGDQLLQVGFYSRLLAEVQGRSPEFGYLVLKDGREERFRLVDFDAAIEEAEVEVRRILADPHSERPFLSHHCLRCRWSELCGAELEHADDLSLVQGMTRGLRTLLERNGLKSCSQLRTMSVDRTARRTHVASPQLRRIQRAAQARAEGRPLLEKRAETRVEKRGELPASALVHFLTDPFHRRVLYMGLLYPLGSGGKLTAAVPASREEEWPAFESLVRPLPPEVLLLHYGAVVTTWYEESVRGGAIGRGRFVDLARQLRGAAVFPGPVFGLGDHVRLGLAEDPDRAGHAGAAPLWAGTPEGEAWLTEKGSSDLGDLARLHAKFLEEKGQGDGSAS